LTPEGYLENLNFERHVMVAIGGIADGASVELKSLDDTVC
jgi:hypothetical protein